MIAASVCILVIFVAPASANFADMLQKVRQAMTVSYKATLQVPGMPAATHLVQMKRPGKYRSTSLVDGRILIVDSVEHRVLGLNPSKKTGAFRPWTSLAEPMDDLEHASATDGEYVGNEQQGGHVLWIYKVRRPDRVLQIWADSKTELPVRIQVNYGAKSTPGQPSMTLENLQWDIAISGDVFALRACKEIK